jgi:uncharacterized protein
MTPRVANVDDDFVLREAMIPMRDRVRLRTLILSPKSSRSSPILLLRTPYDASRRLRVPQRTGLHSVLGISHAELRGYTFVFQDIRGCGGSKGVFDLCRPPRGPLNKTRSDESTDAWDTVDWLVRNTVRTNGKVAVYGTSYEGWAALMALLDPHPALKAAVPVNPLADGWLGDDWFHNGAFRQSYAFEYVHLMQTKANALTPFAFNDHDLYSWWLKAGSPYKAGRRYLDGKRHKFWTTLIRNSEYSQFWKMSAVDSMLRDSSAPLIPTLLVHGWFDQEDMYGAPAAYAALKSRDDEQGSIYFSAGPWFHGQNWGAGERIGPVSWLEDTARRWREDQLAPFLAHYLRDGRPHDLAPVNVFNTGTRRWERLDSWPAPGGVDDQALYLRAGGSLSWTAPPSRKGSEQFVSDPSKPVPYQPRPVRRTNSDEVNATAWRGWLTADQRFVDGRPDVLTFVGSPLQQAVTVRGPVTARLFAETSGSDADWVVKLIDAFPEMDAVEPEMSGYQLMISGDIFRGRFRTGFEKGKRIAPRRTLEYVIRLPQVNHTFREGHRIMVQVQSTWFPLYDRNPQRFVPNVMRAKAHDYMMATHRIHGSSVCPSRIELQVDRLSDKASTRQRDWGDEK